MTPAPSEFTFEPLFLVLALAAALLYGRAARRERPPAYRIALFGLGVALVAGALNSPLETLAAHYLLLFHLLQNVIVADWAPPLLILGLTPAMRAALRRRGGRALELLTRPRVALPVWLAGWYGIHLAAVYDFALENSWALNVEHGLLLALGLVFWWPVFEPEPRRLSTPFALGYLFAAFALSAFLGLALMFSSTPFYDFYAEAPRLWGLSPVKDQNLGGILMNAEQTIVFFVALAWFVLRLFDEEDEAQRTRER
ncbi:MAG: cytochrome c oxidase assembly protein [Gaiellaceae bacterium]